MTIALDASNLTLDQVHQLLKLERRVDRLTPLLTLKELTESERQDLAQIRESFITYYQKSNILEGQIQYLFLSPLMWLAGFHNPRIRLDLEVGISSIVNSI